ncbi:hypothetical protein EDD15DRAFT_2193962 [Pisolithus albus]|nr:hypothetical protein EDD15DRAFT_2193962 [Pisolithus albus]
MPSLQTHETSIPNSWEAYYNLQESGWESTFLDAYTALGWPFSSQRPCLRESLVYEAGIDAFSSPKVSGCEELPERVLKRRVPEGEIAQEGGQERVRRIRIFLSEGRLSAMHFNPPPTYYATCLGGDYTDLDVLSRSQGFVTATSTRASIFIQAESQVLEKGDELDMPHFKKNLPMCLILRSGPTVTPIDQDSRDILALT